MTCEKCGIVLKTVMRFCPSCGEPVDGAERSSEDKIVTLLRQLKKEKKYGEIVHYALTGNAYAEYLYLDHAVEKAKTWSQSAQGSGEVKSAMEQGQPAGMAIWGIILYTTFRPKGIFEEIFEGPNYDDESFDKGIALVRRAADLGDPAAAYYMGGWCMSGNIRKIPKNERDAFRYIQTAAKKGYPAAMYRLGQWYLTGTNGVRRDEALGLDWVEKAAFYDVPAAIDFVQKGNGRWRETDFQAAEDREQIDLAKKFLTSTKRPAVADVVADLDMECLFDGVLFDSPEKARRGKAEGEVAENILMGMDKPDGDLLALHKILSFDPTVLDKVAYRAYIRLAISDRVGIDVGNVDFYVKQGARCGEQVGERIFLTEIPEQTVKLLRDATSKNDKYFLQAGGKAIAPGSITDKVRLAFQIPPDEPIFSVQPSGSHPINPYFEKMTGCVAARSGLYFRGNNRTSGHIPWSEYRNANIEILDDSRSTDPPTWLRINRASFVYTHAIRDQHWFLVGLKWLVSVIHKAPGDQKSEAPGPAEPEKARPSVPKPTPEPVRESSPVPEPIPERPLVQAPATERQQDQRLCPSCHKPNKPTAKFCSYCGEPLEEPRFCQACGARLRPGKKFCSNCGAKIE